MNLFYYEFKSKIKKNIVFFFVFFLGGGGGGGKGEGARKSGFILQGIQI